MVAGYGSTKSSLEEFRGGGCGGEAWRWAEDRESRMFGACFQPL